MEISAVFTLNKIQNFNYFLTKNTTMLATPQAFMIPILESNKKENIQSPWFKCTAMSRIQLLPTLYVIYLFKIKILLKI